MSIIDVKSTFMRFIRFQLEFLALCLSFNYKLAGRVPYEPVEVGDPIDKYI